MRTAYFVYPLCFDSVNKPGERLLTSPATKGNVMRWSVVVKLLAFFAEITETQLYFY